MARVKVTTTDIFAKLAKGECANYRNGRCAGNAVCSVAEGEQCDYFDQYVKPLLDYPEFSAKYGREAKVALALNPKSKVVRKRRATQETLIKIEAAPTANNGNGKNRNAGNGKSTTAGTKPAAPAPAPPAQQAPAAAKSPAPSTTATRPAQKASRAPEPSGPQLVLEIVPSTPPKRASARRR